MLYMLWAYWNRRKYLKLVSLAMSAGGFTFKLIELPKKNQSIAAVRISFYRQKSEKMS